MAGSVSLGSLTSPGPEFGRCHRSCTIPLYEEGAVSITWWMQLSIIHLRNCRLSISVTEDPQDKSHSLSSLTKLHLHFRGSSRATPITVFYCADGWWQRTRTALVHFRPERIWSITRLTRKRSCYTTLRVETISFSAGAISIFTYNPRPNWAAQRAPVFFSQIAPEVPGISLWDLPYLSEQQFHTLCQTIRSQVIIGQPWVTSEWRHVPPILTINKGWQETPSRAGPRLRNFDWRGRSIGIGHTPILGG